MWSIRIFILYHGVFHLSINRFLISSIFVAMPFLRNQADLNIFELERCRCVNNLLVIYLTIICEISLNVTYLIPLRTILAVLKSNNIVFAIASN